MVWANGYGKISLSFQLLSKVFLISWVSSHLKHQVWDGYTKLKFLLSPLPPWQAALGGVAPMRQASPDVAGTLGAIWWHTEPDEP